MTSLGGILNNHSYANIYYVGNCGWTIQSEEESHQSSGDTTDKLVVKWRGRADELFIPPTMHRGLTLNEWRRTEQGPFNEVEVTYGGFSGSSAEDGSGNEDEVGKVYIDSSTSIGNSTRSCDSPEKASREVTYIQPVTIRRWISKTPVYSAGHNMVNAASFRVLKSVIIDEGGKRYPGLAPANLVAALQMFQDYHTTVNCTGRENGKGVTLYDVQATTTLIYE